MDKVRVAAVCFSAAIKDIKGNLDRMEQYVREAKEAGAAIICFPELSVTGYFLSNPAAICPRPEYEYALKRLEKTARLNRMIILAGIMEPSDDGRPFIAHLVTGPKGLIGLYRKTHLSPKEKEIYREGQRIDTFGFGQLNFGIQLCYETHFPEISTSMALKGAEIIFAPHASPRGTPEDKIESWLRHLSARAFDNACFIIACNQCGKNAAGLSFPGVILAFNPSGRILAESYQDKDHMLLIDLDMKELKKIKAHKMRYFLPNRRPELYGDLVDSRG